MASNPMASQHYLDALRMYCNAATPAPWEVGEDEREQAATLRAQPILATTGAPSGPPTDVIIPFGRAFSDARFCAEARSAVPQLLDEIERLRKLLAHDTRWRSNYECQLGDERDAARAQLVAVEPLIEARRACAAAYREVEAWMREQGKQGRLRQNGEAPAWPTYEAAHAQWLKVLAAFDASLE